MNSSKSSPFVTWMQRDLQIFNSFCNFQYLKFEFNLKCEEGLNKVGLLI